MSFFGRIKKSSKKPEHNSNISGNSGSNRFRIELQGEEIEFTLKLAKRKTIAIQVALTGEVTVKAPVRASYGKIFEFVQSKAVWILAKKAEFGTNPGLLPENVFKFLGENYEREVKLGIANKVYLSGKNIIVETIHPRNKAKIQAQIDDWYRQQAELIFAQRLPECVKIAKKIGVNFDNELKLRKMKSRWGSCTFDGEITLNVELVAAPEVCIDYVILHELCHIREHNHSPDFYALMDVVMPEWRKVKKLLNKTVQIRKM